MERYLSLALLLALLLTTVNCTALAETDDAGIEEAVLAESDIGLSDALDPEDLDVVDIDLSNELVADGSPLITDEEDELSGVPSQPNKSSPVLSDTSITIGEKEIKRCLSNFKPNL